MMWLLLVVATASAACRDAATYDTPAAKQRALAIANRRLTEIIRDASSPTHVIRTGLNGAETQIAYDAMLGWRSKPRVLAIAHVNNGIVPENARGYTRRGDPAFANFARRYLEAVERRGGCEVEELRAPVSRRRLRLSGTRRVAAATGEL